jgi:uncharacterized protein
MKIAIFGATGHTGRYILRDALREGHNVAALVRNPSKLPPGGYKLTIQLGDATDADNVEDAIFGQQAVISALGLADDSRPDTISVAVDHIVNAMRTNGLQRLVVIGGAGVLLDSKRGGMRVDSPTYPEQYRVVGLEHRRVYETLQTSNLDWTMICPPTMVESEAETSSDLRWELDKLPEQGKRASYAAVARFAFEALITNEYIRRRVGVAE